MRERASAFHSLSGLSLGLALSLSASLAPAKDAVTKTKGSTSGAEGAALEESTGSESSEPTDTKAAGDDQNNASDGAKAEENSKGEAAPSMPPSAIAVRGPSPLELTAGLRAVHRDFSYHDTPAERFPGRGLPEPTTYKLPLGPAVFIDGAVYPLAFGSRGAAAAFGIAGGYEQNFATQSVYGASASDAGKLTTHASQYYVGLKGRIPVSVHELGLLAAYGRQVFDLGAHATTPHGEQVPDVAYRFIRLSGEARFRLGDASLGFHVGTRLVNDTGGLERNWFPHVKTQSVEAGLLAGYRLSASIDFVLGVDLLRYAFNFNPIPNTANPYTAVIAGGAVDQYTSGWLGLRFALPNSSN